MRACSHLRSHVKVRPEGRGGEKAGDHSIYATSNTGSLAGKVRFHDTEVLAKLRYIPAVAAKQSDGRLRCDDGIALAGDGFDQRGFSAAVQAEDRYVFAG